VDVVLPRYAASVETLATAFTPPATSPPICRRGLHPVMNLPSALLS